MKPTDALPHPADWSTGTVARIAELKRGVSWSKSQEHSEPRTGAVPVVRIGNVHERLDLAELLYISGLTTVEIEKYQVEAGWSLVVGSNGNRSRVGNTVLVREDASLLFASFLLGVRPRSDSGVLPEFFGKWLRTAEVQAYLSASSEGTTGLNNLSQSFFKSMTVPFPPDPEEQLAIVQRLDAVESLIDRIDIEVHQVAELRRAWLQRFFYEALGDTAYADRPRRIIPQEWRLLQARELLDGDPKNGVSPPASSQPPGVPTFSIAAVRDGRVDLATSEHIKYAHLPEKAAERYRVRRGDVLIVRGNANANLVGKAGMIDSFPDGCIYPDITKRVAFRELRDGGGVTPEFAVLAWNHPVVHNQVLRKAKTSNGTLKINNRDVRQIVVPVPSPTEQAELVGLVAALDSQVRALRRLRGAVRQLLQSVTYDLLTGTVRVGRGNPVKTFNDD